MPSLPSTLFRDILQSGTKDVHDWLANAVRGYNKQPTHTKRTSHTYTQGDTKMENYAVIVVCASRIRAQIKAECLTQTNRFRLMDITSWLLKHEQKSWGWTLPFLKSSPVSLQTHLFNTKGSDHLGSLQSSSLLAPTICTY